MREVPAPGDPVVVRRDEERLSRRVDLSSGYEELLICGSLSDRIRLRSTHFLTQLGSAVDLLSQAQKPLALDGSTQFNASTPCVERAAPQQPERRSAPSAL